MAVVIAYRGAGLEAFYFDRRPDAYAFARDLRNLYGYWRVTVR